MLHQITNLKPSSAGISVKNKTKKIIYLKFKIMNIFFLYSKLKMEFVLWLNAANSLMDRKN